MTRIYLVDSENIGASWSQLLSSMCKEDKMFVFYTEKSPYISYDNLLQVIAHCDIPVFIKCYEGKNALDFQLVSELGFMLCQEPEAEFIIVSDDYGYDAAVRYWKERQYNVQRIGKKYCKPLSPKKDKEQVEPVVVPEDAVKAVLADKQETVMEQLVPENKDVEDAAVKPEPDQSAEAQIEESQIEESPNAEAQIEESQIEESPNEETQIEEMQTEESQMEDMEEMIAQKLTESEVITEQSAEAERAVTMAEAQEQQEVLEEVTNRPQEPDVQQNSLREKQAQKRTKERRKKNKKEPAKESVKEEEIKQDDTVKAEQENPLDLLLLEITQKCESADPMKDAFSIKEMFYSISMGSLTDVNTALKVLIGNEVGNSIYRELKEHQAYRAMLDDLYIPDAKRRFMKYVQTVLERSNLEGISAKTIGDFLLAIPRKNLNSIRSAMIKEYGQEQGSLLYAVFKPHIKVLNNI